MTLPDALNLNKTGFAASVEEWEENNAFETFNIKGPMGKGLCLEDHGVHVAFCAGTGVLVFLDLVSHMLLRAYYKHYVD